VRSGSSAAWPAAAAAEDEQNQADLEKLVELIGSPVMQAAVRRGIEEFCGGQRVLKEIYMPLGRKAELVTCNADGGDTLIIDGNAVCPDEGLKAFDDLFEGRGLPAALRRTGVDGTLHRISRTNNPLTHRVTSVAARVGRVIQGHVEALLAPTMGAKLGPLLQGKQSVVIIGPPNVGKTTVLREFARILSESKSEPDPRTGGKAWRQRVVAVIDKSLELGGSGDVPHTALGPVRELGDTSNL
jgi:stage III sporulation protein SpoIIIAA